MARIKQGLGCFVVPALVVVGVEVGLWLTNHAEVAIAGLAVIGALGIFAVGNVWAAMLMKSGAELTIRSQESDDARDIAQIRAATDLVKVLMRKEEQEQKAQEQQPKLPMPQQQATSWLAEYPPVDGEFAELPDKKETN